VWLDRPDELKNTSNEEVYYKNEAATAADHGAIRIIYPSTYQGKTHRRPNTDKAQRYNIHSINFPRFERC